MSKEIKYGKAWVMQLISALGASILVGIISGIVFGIPLGLSGLSPEAQGIIGGIIGMVPGFYVAYRVYAWSIKKYILPQLTTA